jgi:hypothetical protein
MSGATAELVQSRFQADARLEAGLISAYGVLKKFATNC